MENTAVKNSVTVEFLHKLSAGLLFYFSEKVAGNILNEVENPHIYYITAIACALVVLLMTHFIGKTPLIHDLEELCLYDVFVAIYGYISGKLGFDYTSFWILASVVFHLKFTRLIWWGRDSQGQLLATWPTFGLLGLLRKKRGQEPLTRLQKVILAVACIMALVVPILRWVYFGKIDGSFYPFLFLLTVLFGIKPIINIVTLSEAAREAAEREKGALEKQAEIDANVKERNADLRQAAHDMLGPLKAITTIAAEIARSEDLASARQAAGHVQNGLIELDDLMREVIVMAKIVTQLQTPNDEIIDMGKLGDYFQLYLTNIAMERHIHLSVDPASYKVMSNAWLLKRIIYNLLMNAINHGDNQTNVRLYLRKNAHWCYIRIWDTGPGIPHANGPDRAANLTNLLNNEYMLQHAGEDDSTHYLGGYGLGLRGVLRMCHTLGITITLVSKPHHTVFRFRVPLADLRKLPPASNEPDLFNLDPEAEPPVKK